MLFNSYVYVFLCLPIVCFFYYLLNLIGNRTLSIGFLTFSSLVFYSYWDVSFTPILLISIMINYGVGFLISKYRIYSFYLSTRVLLLLGILFNVFLLCYFKYIDFILGILCNITNTSSDFQLLALVLPLGISFFTFVQIAFLVDTYKGKAKKYNFLNYCLFVSFFPHLIAGPILHHSEMMPQFENLKTGRINWENLYKGLIIFL